MPETTLEKPPIESQDELKLPPPPDLKRGKAKPKKKSRWVTWLVVIIILGIGGYFVRQRLAAKADPSAVAGAGARGANAPVPVVVAVARKGALPVHLAGLGSVSPLNTVTVKSRVDGQLIKVAFQEGQFVKAGDLLAEIDPRPFEVVLAQMNAQYARDDAQYNNAKVDEARYQDLFKQGVIPQQQLATQTALVKQYAGVLKADQAQIDNAKLQLSFTKITAPIGGRLGLRQVDAGNMIHAADQNGLVVITQVQPIAVLFPIPEDSLKEVLRRLRSGEHMPVEAYDRSGQNKIATGKLQTVDNEIDQTTGTVRLKAVFDNKDNALFPSQFVNVSLLVDIKQDKVLIPSVAIQRGPKGTFVYVVKDDQTVEVKDVKTGITEGADTAIDEGLNGGESVVTDGTDKLRSGAKVVISQPGGRGGGQKNDSGGAGDDTKAPSDKKGGGKARTQQ